MATARHGMRLAAQLAIELMKTLGRTVSIDELVDANNYTIIKQYIMTLSSDNTKAEMGRCLMK